MFEAGIIMKIEQEALIENNSYEDKFSIEAYSILAKNNNERR